MVGPGGTDRAEEDAVDFTPVGPTSREEGPDPDEVLAEAARRLLDAQVSASDALDSRITAAFGVGSTVLPVTIGLLNLLQTGLTRATEVLLAGALAAYVVQIGCASVLFLSRKRELEYFPNIETLQTYTAEYSGTLLRRWVANEHVRAIAFNRRVLRWKGRWAIGVIAALYVEAVLLSLAAFLALI